MEKSPRKPRLVLRWTPAQLSWLQRAKNAGWSGGFAARPNRALVFLERITAIERDPSTSGVNTHWRITDHGFALAKALSI
jgi:hypothetical protein